MCRYELHSIGSSELHSIRILRARFAGKQEEVQQYRQLFIASWGIPDCDLNTVQGCLYAEHVEALRYRFLPGPSSVVTSWAL